jgi:prepilin-type N-terminal cleavage/methylation domain-containing protein
MAHRWNNGSGWSIARRSIMPAFPARCARAFTLIELVVVLAILVVLIGLLMAAVQKAREAADRRQCIHNLGQLGSACQNCNATIGRLPPGVGWFPDKSPPTPGEKGAYGNALFHLLPYLSQDNLYKSSEVGGLSFAGNNNVYASPVKILLCPSDPTVGGDGLVKDNQGKVWGASSYAGNAQVFTQVDAQGNLLDPQGAARIPATFSDGTSNTILFAEKYSRCTSLVWPEGGSFWSYWITDRSGQPLHPAFAISWSRGSIGPNSRFQLNPRPSDCDPTLAATGHAGGMEVGLADGSVRFVSARISGETWWAACTPNGGEVFGNDW